MSLGPRSNGLFEGSATDVENPSPRPPGMQGHDAADVAVPEGSSHSTELAKKRTRLADDRTTAANQRTSLASHRSHLANERTHLAYLRTAVALIGFGITLNRFAMYLIQNTRDLSTATGAAPLTDVKHVGLAMVLLGIATALWALYRYRRASHDIEHLIRHHDWHAVAGLTVGFILLGASVAVWLFTRQ